MVNTEKEELILEAFVFGLSLCNYKEIEVSNRNDIVKPDNKKSET